MDGAAYCDRCGADLAATDSVVAAGEHIGCVRERELEPPRFCPHCRRRMVVQVTPGGWSARCSEHGTTTG